MAADGPAISMTLVEIVPYRSEWAQEFRRVAKDLRGALGPLALRIDHIGSTAVPGLAAKDVIDVQVTVAALEEAVRAAMLSLGYSEREGMTDHRPPGVASEDSQWAKWLFMSAPDQRRAHVHVRVDGSANQRFALLFRDYLRAHPATAEAYAELKRRLAQHLADANTYPDVKDPAVDLIYLAAEDWARNVGWQPPESAA